MFSLTANVTVKSLQKSQLTQVKLVYEACECRPTHLILIQITSYLCFKTYQDASIK